MKLMKTLLAASALAVASASAAYADPPWARGHDRYDHRYDHSYRHAHWQVGHRLDRGTRYIVVRDYGRYHLRPPPRGYYYADVDGRILLVAAATDIILRAMS